MRDLLWPIMSMPRGAKRREMILAWLELVEKTRPLIPEGEFHPIGLLVNARCQPIIDKDPDLQYLLKKGKVKQVRTRLNHRTRGSIWPPINKGITFKSSEQRRTYLVLNYDLDQ